MFDSKRSPPVHHLTHRQTFLLYFTHMIPFRIHHGMRSASRFRRKIFLPPKRAPGSTNVNIITASGPSPIPLHFVVPPCSSLSGPCSASTLHVVSGLSGFVLRLIPVNSGMGLLLAERGRDFLVIFFPTLFRLSCRSVADHRASDLRIQNSVSPFSSLPAGLSHYRATSILGRRLAER